MKVLLLTDMPPCENFTAGLVLAELCSFLPQDSLACYAVVNPALDPQIPPSLSWMPVEFDVKPRENWLFRSKPIGGLISLIMEGYTTWISVRKIANRAIEFGRKFGADLLWCILEGQTMIRLSIPVSRGLGIPLFTEVWDPPGWWLRENKVDRITTRRVLEDFEKAVRGSVRCGTASWAMAEQYSQDYETETVPLLPSLSLDQAMLPATEPNQGGDFTIGLAGQIYASAEWNALIEALTSADWKICGRDVKIRLLGQWIGIGANGKMRVEFLGWHSQRETVKLLSEADVLYCPYWFDPAFETEARLSFPSKLTTYLASGRPVLFHGPRYGSPGRFLEEHRAGVCCYSLEAGEILKTLEELVVNVDLYSDITRNGRKAFEEHLTVATLRKSFSQFLESK
jgi:glycosyltransferase involved in cell wall biosynthesis